MKIANKRKELESKYQLGTYAKIEKPSKELASFVYFNGTRITVEHSKHAVHMEVRKFDEVLETLTL